MKHSEIVGTLTGFSALGADAATSQTPLLPMPDTHTTGHLWVDVAIMAVRGIAILGVTIAPVVVGKYIDHRTAKKKEKEGSK